MIRLTQKRTGRNGTCFQTALASILETTVPDFGPTGETDEREYWRRVDNWLAGKGFRYVQVPVGAVKPIGYSTMEGISPRGGMHAVVAYNGDLVWDPHPQDGTPHGLAKPMTWGLLLPLGGSQTKTSNVARDAYAKWWTEAEIYRLADPGKNGVRAAARITRDLAEQSYFYWENEAKAAEELGHLDDAKKAYAQRDVYAKMLKRAKVNDALAPVPPFNPGDPIKLKNGRKSTVTKCIAAENLFHEPEWHVSTASGDVVIVPVGGAKPKYKDTQAYKRLSPSRKFTV